MGHFSQAAIENRLIANTKHGEAKRGGKTAEWRAWTAMKNRCYTKSHIHYSYYGERGIRVCKKWLSSYSSFLADVGRKPSPKHTLDRINGNKNYTPSNCRWATRKEQGEKKSNSVMITLNNKTNNIAQWSRKLGLHRETIKSRLKKGWPPAMVLSKQHFKNGSKKITL
jgi:hypothetical protein